jgi:multidrug efflux pump subunit AcrB
VQISLGFVGVQPGAYPVNTIHLWTGGPEEAVMPGVRFSFDPSDIVSRVMSFGARTPVEVSASGPNMANNRLFAERLRKELAGVPSLRDLQYEQALDYPTLRVDVARERAGVLGVSVSEVARSLVSATWSSRYVAANYWADPKSGVAYQLQVEIPQKQMASAEDVRNLPVARKAGEQVPLRAVASVTPGTAVGQYDRYNMQRSVTLSANVAGEDLGGAVARVEKAVAAAGKPPEKVTVNVRGQAAPLAEVLGGLTTGLVVAVVVVFLLLAATFQSFKLAVAVLLTTPAVLAGVAVALAVTHTTLNIQSFMGAIMAIGVAVANSILLVTFAERRRMAGAGARQAAVEGAAGRLRPILMTSLAMIAGMMPMAIGLGEGGEQTAPLGRAVIGGLAGATLATRVVSPAIFALLQGDRRRSASLDPDDERSANYAGGRGIARPAAAAAAAAVHA